MLHRFLLTSCRHYIRPATNLHIGSYGLRNYATATTDEATDAATSLDELKQVELMKLVEQCGLGCSGTKQELRDRLCSHLRRTAILIEQPDYLHPVLSIDVGYRNMAYAIVGPRLDILAWKRTHIDVPESYEPDTFTRAVCAFVDQLPMHYGVKTAIIERQRFRSAGMRIIPEPILRSNVVEALLHALLPQRGVHVESVQTMKIARHFPSAFDREEMNAEPKSSKKEGKKSSTTRRKPSDKKSNARTLVTALLNRDDIISCPDELRQHFDSNTKQDDLSDCLLQAIAWLDWRMFSMQQVERWRKDL